MVGDESDLGDFPVFEADETELDVWDSGSLDEDDVPIEEPEDIKAAFEAWWPDEAGRDEVYEFDDEDEYGYMVDEDDVQPQVLAPHPFLPVVLMHTDEHPVDRRVWVAEAETRTILWQPEGALYMAWLRNGIEIGVIIEKFTPDPHHPAVIGSRLQSEMAYTFHRWTWPDLHHISACPITMRTGWPTALLPTPDPNFVMFEWYDQGEAGYEGFRLDDLHGDTQDKRESYEIGMPMLGHELPIIFSDDARYLVRCHSIALPDAIQDDWNHTLVIAYLTIIDRQIPAIRDIPITTTLSPGWSLSEAYRPKSSSLPHDRAYWYTHSWVQACSFEGAPHVILRFFDDTSLRIDITAPELASLPPLPDYLPISHEMPQIDRETLQRLMKENSQENFPRPQPVRHHSDDASIMPADRYAQKQKQWIARDDGQVLWDPGDVLHMIWLRNGQEVAALRGEQFVYGKQRDQHIVFERRSWPGLALLSQLSLSDWVGGPFGMTALSHDQGIIILWNTYTYDNGTENDFLYRVLLSDQGNIDRIDTKIYTQLQPVAAQNEQSTQVFCLRSNGVLWPTHAEMFRWRRHMIVGWATLFDWQTHHAREIALCTDFPANWQPPDIAQRRSPLLPFYLQTPILFIEDVSFQDDAHIRVRFATKETSILPVE